MNQIVPKIIRTQLIKGRLDASMRRLIAEDSKVRARVLYVAIGRIPASSFLGRRRMLALTKLCLTDDPIDHASVAFTRGKPALARELLAPVLAAGAGHPRHDVAARLTWLMDRAWDPLSDRSPDGKPPLIFQYWDKNIPDDVAAQVNRWRSIFGAEKHRMFNDEEARDLVVDYAGAEAGQLYDSAKFAAVKSDIFRLVALNRFGGVYVDADIAPGRRAKRMLLKMSGKNAIWVRNDRPRMQFTNMFFSSASAWPVLDISLQRGLDNLKHHPDMNPMDLSGPHLFTDVILQEAADGDGVKALRSYQVNPDLIEHYQPAYKSTNLSWQKHFGPSTNAS